ncbi:hypothetical protein BN2127_JRS10_02587 [Bacillus subtilis]|nr:hypothetical protein BN2127_JRS10_02587 [Bacillus subtilis]
MDIQALKKCITHFSEQIHLSGVHKDEVKVGGRITDVFHPQEFIPGGASLVIIDDFVGTLRVSVPEEVTQAHLNDLVVGNYVSFEGFVNTVSRSSGIEVSVVAYAANNLLEECTK